jgi:transporter family-2 protein
MQRRDEGFAPIEALGAYVKAMRCLSPAAAHASELPFDTAAVEFYDFDSQYSDTIIHGLQSIGPAENSNGAMREERETYAMSALVSLLGWTLLASGAGISFVMQQAVNANLRTVLGSAAWAGFISYLGGTLCMLALAIAMRAAIPPIALAVRGSWWAWSGGFFGAIYIAISILLVPRLGTATFIALLVAGQMLSSMVFDHYGLFGVVPHPIDPSRVLGAVLLVSGVILIRF